MKVHAFFIGVFASFPKANQKCGHSPLRAQATCAVAARSTSLCLRSRGNGHFACPSSSTAHSFTALTSRYGTAAAKNRSSFRGRLSSAAQTIAGIATGGTAASCRLRPHPCEKSSPAYAGISKPRRSRPVSQDCINPSWHAVPNWVTEGARRVVRHLTDRREKRRDNPELSDKPIRTECQITHREG